MNIKIYYNPKELLNAAGAGWVWEVVFLIIMMGLTISFVIEVFKIQKKEKPDFFGIIWKTIVIVILYRFLPDAIERTMNFVNSTVSSERLDKEFYKAFSLFSSNLSQTEIISKELPQGCPMFVDITLMQSGISFISAYSFQYFSKMFLFFMMMSVWIIKEIVFSWSWPVLMSINMIGLCAALAVPAFPNQGFGSVGSFFKSVAVFSLWPVIYSVFIFVTGDALTEIMKLTQSTLLCPTSFEVGKKTIISMSGIIFMAFGIGYIPILSRKIVFSSQIKELVTNVRASKVTEIIKNKVR